MQEIIKIISELLEENNTSKKVIAEIQCNKNNLLESCKIKKIVMKLLEEYLKALEEYFNKVISEGDVRIQELIKIDSHAKAHHAYKEREIED